MVHGHNYDCEGEGEAPYHLIWKGSFNIAPRFDQDLTFEIEVGSRARHQITFTLFTHWCSPFNRGNLIQLRTSFRHIEGRYFAQILRFNVH